MLREFQRLSFTRPLTDIADWGAWVKQKVRAALLRWVWASTIAVTDIFTRHGGREPTLGSKGAPRAAKRELCALLPTLR
jgi:hypothetical protein